MAPRANWQGYLKLSLVSCAVALYPASSTRERVSFNTLNRKTGNKVKRIYVDPESGEEVTGDDQVKGYAIAKDQYVYVENDELDAVKIESSHTIDIEKFVPRSEIDPRYLEVPYYITPNDRVSQEAFAVIRDAMRDAKVVGIARVVISRRERIIMLEPLENGLLGTVLRYAYEVRSEKDYFDAIPGTELPGEMTDLAHVIIGRKAGHFDATEFKDRYEDALVSLVRSKQAGTPTAAPAEAQASNVINLMEALRRSIGSDPAATKSKDKPAATAPPTEAIPAKPRAKSKAKVEEPSTKASSKKWPGKSKKAG